jgi:hypothetical protein
VLFRILFLVRSLEIFNLALLCTSYAAFYASAFVRMHLQVLSMPSIF